MDKTYWSSVMKSMSKNWLFYIAVLGGVVFLASMTGIF